MSFAEGLKNTGASTAGVIPVLDVAILEVDQNAIFVAYLQQWSSRDNGRLTERCRQAATVSRTEHMPINDIFAAQELEVAAYAACHVLLRSESNPFKSTPPSQELGRHWLNNLDKAAGLPLRLLLIAALLGDDEVFESGSMTTMFEVCVHRLSKSNDQELEGDARWQLVDLGLILSLILQKRTGGVSGLAAAAAHHAGGGANDSSSTSLAHDADLDYVVNELFPKYPMLHTSALRAREADISKKAVSSDLSLWTNWRHAAGLESVNTPVPSPVLRPRRTIFQTATDSAFALPLHDKSWLSVPASVTEAISLLGRHWKKDIHDLQLYQELQAHSQGDCHEITKTCQAYSAYMHNYAPYLDDWYRILLPQVDDLIAVLMSILEASLGMIDSIANTLAPELIDGASADGEDEMLAWLFHDNDDEDISNLGIILSEQRTIQTIYDLLGSLLEMTAAAHVCRSEYIATTIWDHDYASSMSRTLRVFGQLIFPYRVRHRLSKSGAGKADTDPNRRPCMLQTTIDTMRASVDLAERLVGPHPRRACAFLPQREGQHLKRCLQLPDSRLNLASLQLYKLMMPFTPRKWRQSNMKIITQIYLCCPTYLRDDWLASIDPGYMHTSNSNSSMAYHSGGPASSLNDLNDRLAPTNGGMTDATFTMALSREIVRRKVVQVYNSNFSKSVVSEQYHEADYQQLAVVGQRGGLLSARAGD
ncbi:Factor arrest protein 11 [Savitreella phatthalungensis]